MYEQLTRREHEVICLLEGRTNRQIGLALGISSGTVSGYITSAAIKLECSGKGGKSIRLRLVLKALRLGFVTMSEIKEAPRRKRVGVI